MFSICESTLFYASLIVMVNWLNGASSEKSSKCYAAWNENASIAKTDLNQQRHHIEQCEYRS